MMRFKEQTLFIIYIYIAMYIIYNFTKYKYSNYNKLMNVQSFLGMVWYCPTILVWRGPELVLSQRENHQDREVDTALQPGK